MEEEQGRGLALTGRRHPNPTADCSHTAGKEERRGKKGKKDGNQQVESRRREAGRKRRKETNSSDGWR